MPNSPNTTPIPTWRLLLAHPWARLAAAGATGALLLTLAVGIDFMRGQSGSANSKNTGELPTAPDTATPNADLHGQSALAAKNVENVVDAENLVGKHAVAEAPAPEAPVQRDPVSASGDHVSSESPPKDSENEPAAVDTATETPRQAPDHIVVEVTEDGKIVPGAAASQAELVAEIKRLNEKFDQLQETVNLVVTQMMSDVEDENEQLRAEIQRLQARDQAGLLSSAFVPRPAGELLNSLAEEARGMTDEELEANAAPPEPPAQFTFNIISEWGRDPDAVAQLGGNAPTLKGVVGMVPRGSTREEIEQLGRDLRAQYDNYDNINIEIFDDPVAAQAFADSQTLDPERRVLSISKYAATNRDSMTYYENGESMDLGGQLPEAEEDNADVAPAEVDAPSQEPAPAEASPKAEPGGASPRHGRRSGR